MKTDAQLRLLWTIPEMVLVTAGSVAALAPDLDTLDSAPNCAEWVGLVRRRKSTFGKTRLGSVRKMGQTEIYGLLIAGAMGEIRWVVREGEQNWAAPDRAKLCRR